MSLPSDRRAQGLAALCLAVLATATSLVISTAVLDRIPHVTDGVSYAFEAKLMAAGRLWVEPPAQPLLFAHENILVTATRWCSIYPPGWPAMLALGWLVGAPWTVAPLLLGGAVLGVWRLGSALHQPSTGLLAAAALAVSPFALLMSAGFLAHTPALCATVWSLALLAEAVAAGRPRRLLAAGLVGGLAFLIRPYTAVLLLAPAVVWALVRLRRPAAVAWLAAGGCPAAAVFLLYNKIVFGGALVTGYELFEPQRFASAAAMSVGLGEALGTNLPWFLGHLSRSLWGLPGSDFLLFVPLLWPRPGSRRDGLLAGCAAALVVGHCVYYYHDEAFSGPRLVFEALGPLAVLAARSLQALSGGIGWLLSRLPTEFPRRILRTAILAGAGAGLIWFPLGSRLPAQMAREAQWYLAVSGEPLRRMAAAGVGPSALVFVAGTPYCYSGLFLQNDFPLSSGGRVFVRDIPPLRAAAIRLYPRQEIWQAWVQVEIPDPENAPDLARPVAVSWTRLR